MKNKKEKKKSTFWQDFKAFISRGNIVDLAVAVVVGAAFTAIVNSLVNDIIKPFITWLLGSEDMSDLVVVLREFTNEAGEIERITLNYGNLIMAILTFIIDALVIFTILRIVRNAQRKIKEESGKLRSKLSRGNNQEEIKEEEEVTAAAEVPAEPAKPTLEELLTEIRDLLKAQQLSPDAAEETGKDNNNKE